MMHHLAASSLSLALLGLVACDSPPDTDTGTRALGGDRTPVIIYFSRQVDLPARAAHGRSGRQALIEALHLDAHHAQGRVRALLHQHGIEPGAELWMINALTASLPGKLVEQIEKLPEVERIEADLQAKAPVTSTGSATTPSWNLQAIRAPELWAAGHRGSGVVVATLDTGVDLNHPDLAASWRSTAGWFDPHDQHPSPYDGNGHGTQVMGLLVGGEASGAPIGMAPAAQWISAKIFDDAGLASAGAIHLALQWVLDPDGDPATDDAADIVDGSWGYTQLVNQCYLEFEQDIATLRAAQIANVFAAGNTGPSAASSLSPANNPSSLAAGAVDETLAVVASSGRGPDACTGSIYPELVAPGANVRTTDMTFGGVFPDSYVVVSGTSFAAPHIAGAMALLRDAHPSATVAQLEEALATAAVDLDPAGADNDSGFGMPDLVAAASLLATLVATPTCTDADGDGYFAEPECNSSLDCNDDDGAIHPGACDLRKDGIDQDCDGADRVKGKPCSN